MHALLLNKYDDQYFHSISILVDHLISGKVRGQGLPHDHGLVPDHGLVLEISGYLFNVYGIRLIAKHSLYLADESLRFAHRYSCRRPLLRVTTLAVYKRNGIVSTNPVYQPGSCSNAVWRI